MLCRRFALTPVHGLDIAQRWIEHSTGGVVQLRRICPETGWISYERCNICGFPRKMYGCRDVRTGWEGWCRVCNWHWRHSSDVARARRVAASWRTGTREISLPQTIVQRAIMSYLRPRGREQQEWWSFFGSRDRRSIGRELRLQRWMLLCISCSRLF